MKSIYLYLFLIPLLFVKPATAQPERVWASYYGQYTVPPGTRINNMAYDATSGCIYIVGTTADTTGIASPGSFKDHFQLKPTIFFPFNGTYETDAFIAKFDTLGNRLWASYYGGRKSDFGLGVAVDGLGHVYMAGSSNSDTGIATPGSLQASNADTSGLPFLVKFDSTGQRLWATYYGQGSNFDIGNGLTTANTACDGEGNVYLTGATISDYGIATAGSYQQNLTTVPGHQQDGFIAKFDPNGNRIWGTYYGGRRTDIISNISVSGNDLYIAGYTFSTESIASPGAANTQIADSASGVAFLAKFSLTGQRLWGTYIDGNRVSDPLGLISNGKDGVYISGTTLSDSGLATPNAHQTVLNGYNDLYLIKYNTYGQKIWGTYYGGSGVEYWGFLGGITFGNLAFDEEGNIIMVSGTQSPDHIDQGCGYPATIKHGLFARFSPQGQCLGGSYYDAYLYAVAAADKGRSFYMAGNTIDDGITTFGAFEPTKPANKLSGIFTKFTFSCPDMQPPLTYNNNALTVDSSFLTYQWFQNGQAIDSANNYFFQPTDTGSYYVSVADSCGCTYSSDTLAWPAGTGIGSIPDQNGDINIYPNPNHGIFTIKGFATNAAGIVQYDISDLSGRTLLKGSFHAKGENFSQQIDASALASGLYFLKITTANRITTGKLVVE